MQGEERGQSIRPNCVFSDEKAVVSKRDWRNDLTSTCLIQYKGKERKASCLRVLMLMMVMVTTVLCVKEIKSLSWMKWLGCHQNTKMAQNTINYHQNTEICLPKLHYMFHMYIKSRLLVLGWNSQSLDGESCSKIFVKYTINFKFWVVSFSFGHSLAYEIVFRVVLSVFACDTNSASSFVSVSDPWRIKETWKP